MQNSKLQLKIKKVQDADVSGKKVFLRLDLDIPLENGQILDDSRLLGGEETLNYLLKNGAMVIIAGHLGRPNGRDNSFTLEPIAQWFAGKLKVQSEKLKVGDFDAWKLGENLTLLENLRFYPEEESFGSSSTPLTASAQDKDSGLDFAKKLASLAKIYVNDAFGASHRAHASIVGVPKFLPHFAGLRLQKEVEELSKVLDNPQRPLVVIIGGAKMETKLPLVEKMHNLADYVLVGGEIASKETILSKIQHEKAKAITIVADLNQDGTDITEKSLENFLQFIERAKTTVWNGPMGKVPEHEKSSKVIAEGIIQSSSFNIIGGGDTVSLVKKLGLLDKFSFVSTGGGSMLEFLSGEQLPGLQALV